MKKELQKHLDDFVNYFPGSDDENHPLHEKYLELQAAMQKLNDIPKAEWNKESTIRLLDES